SLWLLASGGALGLALGTLLFAGGPADFLLHNRIPAAHRDRILAFGGAAALALAAVPIAGWLGGRIGAVRLREIGQRLSPLLPAGLAGLLFNAPVWVEAPLTHLVFCAVLAWLLQRSLCARALAPPLRTERWLTERAEASGLGAEARALTGRSA